MSQMLLVRKNLKLFAESEVEYVIESVCCEARHERGFLHTEEKFCRFCGAQVFFLSPSIDMTRVNSAIEKFKESNP